MAKKKIDGYAVGIKQDNGSWAWIKDGRYSGLIEGLSEDENTWRMCPACLDILKDIIGDVDISGERPSPALYRDADKAGELLKNLPGFVVVPVCIVPVESEVEGR